MPKVSVIMPAYNAEKYIGEAIDTVIAQEFADWELVVVDDGSTDSTPELLAAYNDDRIKVVTQQNGGEAAARNTGLRNAVGDYIAFLDSDDFYVPTTLSDRLRYLDAHPEFGVLVADGVFCDEAGTEGEPISSIRDREYVGNILEPLILNPGVVSVPVGITARRALITEHDLWFDTEVGYGTDWDFWTRLARYTDFGFIPTKTYKYRIHGNNMTSTQGAKRKRDWLFGRMKVLNADWFAELSEPTRIQFFRMVLIDLLEQQSDKQLEIMSRDEFKGLPAWAQAQLWRQVAIAHLHGQPNLTFAADCLEEAVQLDPTDRKSRLLLTSIRFSTPLTRLILSGWQLFIRLNNYLKTIGQRRAKAVPSQLVPKS